jgi:hypothetical protein
MSVPLRSRGDGSDIQEQIRFLLREGQISEARELLESAGDRVPADSTLRKVLAPARVIGRSSFRDVDRRPEFHWLKTRSEAYQGKWVALVGENLVAASDTLQELRAQLAKLRLEQRPLIHHLI